MWDFFYPSAPSVLSSQGSNYIISCVSAPYTEILGPYTEILIFSSLSCLIYFYPYTDIGQKKVKIWIPLHRYFNLATTLSSIVQ